MLILGLVLAARGQPEKLMLGHSDEAIGLAAQGVPAALGPTAGMAAATTNCERSGGFLAVVL
jgi:hypothetical protein